VPTRLALVLALLFGVLVAYLTSFNTGRIRVALGSALVYELPLMALVVGAFLLGAGLALLLGVVRDLARSYEDYRKARQSRRAEGLKEVYHRGVDAQLAGKSSAAREAYEAVLQRDPAYADAHVRLAELAREQGDAHGALTHQLEALRADDRPETLLAAAEAYRRAGRTDDAVALYRQVLDRDRDHFTALRGIRDVAVEHGRWTDALGVQERLVHSAPADERPAEEEWLAGIRYELGCALMGEGDTPAAAIARFREALRAQPAFVPAILALGDAHLKSGDAREALRTWERGLEVRPALPLLARIEQVYRDEGRPTRMIGLYQEAAARAPDNLALAFALGRVYFELAMLDEAADQFQKVEVRAPDIPSIHAYLGAILERRGQAREAFEEYRRALRLTGSFDYPHRCAACGAAHPRWVQRCPSCARWNTSIA